MSFWGDLDLCMCAAATAAKSLQSCLTLCDPIDSSPPGSPVPGILQARTLEWVAISSSNAWKWKVKVKSLSHVRLLATPWTAAHQAPPSMGSSRQKYWSGVPLPSPCMCEECPIHSRLSLLDVDDNGFIPSGYMSREIQRPSKINLSTLCLWERTPVHRHQVLPPTTRQDSKANKSQ